MLSEVKKDNLLLKAEYVVDLAKKNGATLAEAYISKNENTSLRLYKSSLDSLRQSTTTGVGIRLLKDSRPGYAYTSDLNVEGLKGLVEQAISNSYFSQPDEFFILPNPSTRTVHMPEIYNDQHSSYSLESKINILKKIEDAARKNNKSLYLLRNHYGEDETEICIANSHGLQETYSTTMSYAWAEVKLDGEKSSQTGNSFTNGRALHELEPEKVGLEAAMQATAFMDAKPIKSTVVPVVIAPKAAINIFSQLASMLTANSLQQGRSLFNNKVNQKVANNSVNIIEDATLKNGLGSRPFDGEGVTSKKNVLIKEGILKGLMHNCTTAFKEGVISTGNASRYSYRSIPSVGASNFYIEPGEKPEEQLLMKMGTGIYILELMGMHAVNPLTGRFSAAIRGYWVENGEKTFPVTEVTLGGEYMSLLQSIDELGSNLEFYPGSTVLGTPSVLIPDMTISGL